MSKATQLFKLIEKLTKQNESARILSNDASLFDIEINSNNISEFLTEINSLLPTLKSPPTKKVKPMLVSLSKFIKQASDNMYYSPLENIKCNLYLVSDMKDDRARFTFSGNGTFFCDSEDDEMKDEAFGQALEPFRCWNQYMSKYSKHIVDCIDDVDIDNQTFSFEVNGEIR